MKDYTKIIAITMIVVVLGIIMATSLAHADSDNGIRFLRETFEAGWTTRVESFEDTKTGIVCYVTRGGTSAAISCVKK